jgi:hypothetical protein
VVNEKALWLVHKFPVHRNNFCSSIGFNYKSHGIDTLAVTLRAPLKIIEPVKVLLVNNCAFAFGEADFAVGLAELAFAIQKHRPGENQVKPIRNTDS